MIEFIHHRTYASGPFAVPDPGGGGTGGQDTDWLNDIFLVYKHNKYCRISQGSFN